MLRGMTRDTETDRAVRAILRRQGELITRRQALAAGLSEAALCRRSSSSGPWRVVLPGIYLSHHGGLTSAQQEFAATLYAGDGCVLTGTTALQVHGARVPHSDLVHVLVPAHVQRQSAGFVRMQRTARLPERPCLIGGIRYAPAARAVADAARGRTEMDIVRSLVAGAVQQRTCTVQELAAELRAGPTQGSAALRAALAEVADGIRSVAEGDLRKVISKGRLPEPMYNPRLFVGEEFIGSPDAWWPEAGVAGEADSREWHLSPADWERTQARHARMSAHGILVLHWAPRRIRSDPAGVIAEITKALQAGRQRAQLPIRAVPAR
jgi:hypothetical protein